MRQGDQSPSPYHHLPVLESDIVIKVYRLLRMIILAENNLY